MVAAGVYLFARLFPFFRLSPTAMTVFLTIGTISMLLASTMAMVSRDIKQVWAYSTISQLGFMIMGLAAGGYVAGVFHLTTHAGFKALLFLCAGVFIHAFKTNDMFAIGRAGGRHLRIPMICMTIGAAALAGLPPLSGFFSKEAIMGQLAGLSNPVWLGAGLLGAFLTAYYTFRLIFAVALPAEDSRTDEMHPDAAHAGHATGPDHDRHYRLMAGPLVMLAAVSLGLGWAHGSLGHFLTDVSPTLAGHPSAHLAWLPYVAIGLALAGVLLAWVEFGRRGAARIGFVERVEPLAQLFAQRWYMDRFYRWFLDRVVYALFSTFCDQSDRRVIDGGLDAMARGTVAGSRRLSVLHLTMVQYKMMVIFAVMGLLTLYFFFG
jgi:NADH-quinone oxidoreductase subunit L